MLKIYIGYDPREDLAYRVAADSIRQHWPDAPITALERTRNEKWRLMMRPYRVYRDSIWDVLSDAPASTEFATTRFLTPLLAQTGWALFVDCDVVFLRDPRALLQYADPRYAVMVVKHDQQPIETRKMAGQIQTSYKRKNWSSVMLFNCEHPGNEGLTLDIINNRPGRDLHGFCWLADDEIGTLPPEWNWLVNVEPEPESPALAHFTLGGPWIKGWEAAPYDDLWREFAKAYDLKRRAPDGSGGQGSMRG